MEYEIDGDEPVSSAVVRAVSAVGGREPEALRPLTAVLDPSALDLLFGKQFDGEPRIGGRVSFVYGACRVTVDAGEFLTVQPLDAGLQRKGGPDPNEPGAQ